MYNNIIFLSFRVFFFFFFFGARLELGSGVENLSWTVRLGLDLVWRVEPHMTGVDVWPCVGQIRIRLKLSWLEIHMVWQYCRITGIIFHVFVLSS